MAWFPQALIVLPLLCGLHQCQALNQGPTLVVEPPAVLRFSSERGARADCAAIGSPPPNLSWILHDDTLVTTIPGVRIILENGSLVFPAFPVQNFRQDVHAATYRCRAANNAGTVLSREVRVIAVLVDFYEPRVQGASADLGSPAVLTCERPDHITVTSWFRDEAVIMAGPPEPGARYVVTSRGDLIIRAMQTEDTKAAYSCLTLNNLTGERKRSPSVRVKSTDSPSGMAPRLLSPVTEIVTEVGRDVHILCSASAQPSPTYTWYRESGIQLYPVIATMHSTISNDVLYIRRVTQEDAGAWLCVARNQYGEQRLRTILIVTSPLTARLQPQLLIANTGSTAHFNCTIGGSPQGHVRWIHNGAAIAGGGRIRVMDHNGDGLYQLSITGVIRADRGIYQCMATSGYDSTQATSELRLGDTAPELQYTFIEQALRGGPPVSLRCSAAGSPPPHIQWFLDGQPLSEIPSSHRYNVGQHVSKNGDVIGHLNISSVRTEDGGLYTCIASNSLGEASHTARLNIYGPPSIRAIGPIRAVAGYNMTLHCPYSGYPIISVSWSRRGQELDSNSRMGSGNQGSLHISRVDPASDAGSYTCTVSSASGESVKRDLQVVVKNPPKLVPFSFPPDLEEGSSVQLLCGMTSGDRPVYFSWLKDGSPIPATLQIQEKSLDEFSFLIFSDVSSKHSGDYTCVASNIAAKVNYTAHLMVKVSPHWTYEPQDVSTLLGTPVIIHCAARGFPEPKITWYKGQGLNTQDFRSIVEFDSRQMVMQNGSLSIPAATTYNEGHYQCKAENGIGTGLSKKIYITVNEPAHFEVSSKNMSVRRNDPVSLVCEVFGDNPIKVQWTHNTKKIDLNTYRLSMSEVRTETGLRSQLQLSRAERRDSGTYRCQAENAFGRSEHLIYISVEERPDPPASLQVVEVGGRNVRLSWLRPFDGNNPVLGYLAQYQLLGSQNKDEWISANIVNVTLDSVKMSYNSIDLERHGGVVGKSEAVVCESLVQGFHPATAYTVRLSAYNAIDQSSYSEPVVVKTTEEAPTDPPMNVQVQSGGQGELHVTWKAPPHDSWNGDLLGYLVTWSEVNPNIPFPSINPNTSKSVTVNGWSNLEVVLTGLRKFTRYGVTVRAFNGVSAGPPSPATTATTQEGVPEGPPNNVVCLALSSQSIKVSWEPPLPGFHGGVLQGYKVIYKPIDQGSSAPVPAEVKRTSSAETYLHGLRRYTNYSVQVFAFTNAGDGKRSSPLHCLTDEDLPGPPANVKASALASDSVLVSWLPPVLKNGRITHYTIYSREAGRVGKHSTTTVSADGTSSGVIGGSLPGPGGYMAAEVRGLQEHRLYEFWVSAATSPGEGEPTAIVAQGTNARAPARIASFSQTIKIALRGSLTLSCLGIGNPAPRTRWVHKGRPVTHSPHYQVTHLGHLDIHSMDISLSGNYTCSAKNIFGEDSIIYNLIPLLPPGAPQLRLQQATSSSIRLHWPTVEDGGSPIHSYLLHFSLEGHAWHTATLNGDLQGYTLEGLSCGSSYLIFMEANNSVDMGPPSQKLRASTKGGVSKVPSEKDLIATNSTCLKLNLLTWDNGGCPISEFLIEYRPLSDSTWKSEKTVLKTEGLVIENLIPATWYFLRLTAVNEAGLTTGKFYFSTLTLDGGRIASPAVFPPHQDLDNPQSGIFNKIMIMWIGLGILILLLISIFSYLAKEKRLFSCFFRGYSRGGISEDEKSVENQDNRRNCQQVYTSSPIKHNINDKNEQQQAEMYEISPYATFSMGSAPGGPPTTLDYSLHFRTFGRTEGEALGPAPARPNLLRSTDRRSTKHRSFSSSDEYTLSKAMTIAAGTSSGGGVPRGRTPRPSPAPPHSAAHDSESDSSGSPCTECNSNPSYRVPINTPKDMFRPVADSSAESHSDLSSGKGTTAESRGSASNRTPRRTPNFLSGGRFQNREEQERKEFTIHV